MTKKSELSIVDLILELLKDSDRKSISRMVAEICYLAFNYRCIPTYYFSRYLFKKERTNILDYLPNKLLYPIKPRFNDEDAWDVVENKLYFDFFYSQFNLSLPQILMYNHKNVFVLNSIKYHIHDVAEFSRLLSELMPLHGSRNSLFIKKTYWSYNSDHIYKLFIQELREPEKIETLYAEVIKSGFLFQETITQHKELDRFNPSCVNTIRFDTFIDQHGKAEIISAYFRTNIKNGYVDNNRVGGCEISVSLETGKLKKYGHLTIKSNGVKLPTEHPITKMVFENFSIPYFDQARELVIKAASLMPCLRLVGWDVAIGETGPILIEGNADYDIPSSDLAYGGYRANPVFRKVLDEINFKY